MTMECFHVHEPHQHVQPEHEENKNEFIDWSLIGVQRWCLYTRCVTVMSLLTDGLFGEDSPFPDNGKCVRSSRSTTLPLCRIPIPTLDFFTELRVVW